MNQDEPRDHYTDAADDDGRRPIEQHLKNSSTWLRLFFMIVVLIIYGVSRIVVGVVILIQFFHVLFTGATNDRLKELGEQLARYTYQIVRYLTFNSEERPFPFDLDWPSTGETERTDEREDDSAV